MSTEKFSANVGKNASSDPKHAVNNLKETLYKYNQILGLK